LNGTAAQPARASGEFLISGELRTAPLGFGATRLTGPGVWGEPEHPDEAVRVLRRAVELGVTLIDTADSYGPEVSERLIREALHPYPTDLVIATKAGLVRPGPGQWEPDGRPEQLRAQAHNSLKLLGLERIALGACPDSVRPRGLGDARVGSGRFGEGQRSTRRLSSASVDAIRTSTVTRSTTPATDPPTT
jgi:hypothetical protein